MRADDKLTAFVELEREALTVTFYPNPLMPARRPSRHKKDGGSCLPPRSVSEHLPPRSCFVRREPVFDLMRNFPAEVTKIVPQPKKTVRAIWLRWASLPVIFVHMPGKLHLHVNVRRPAAALVERWK